MYCPAAHEATTHGPPFGPVNPALQTQAVASVLAVRTPVLEFDGQVSQRLTSPLCGLYFPTTHAVHVPPTLIPVYPGLHRQLAIEVCPTAYVLAFE
jgi:hypothetical protein